MKNLKIVYEYRAIFYSPVTSLFGEKNQQNFFQNYN